MSASAKPGRAVSPRLRVAGSAGSGPIEGVRNGLGASWPACLRTQFAYNGDGVRTSKNVAGDTTQYILDLAATLPVVISDTEAVYLYGLDIIAQQQSERLYYMHDGLGSVRQLLDTAGDLETNYAYDPFGVPMVEGDLSNPYQFTGEAWDAEVDLLYLRARYYQPEVGRFVTKDAWRGSVWKPGTLNDYLYVINNPVNLIDPSGNQGCLPAYRCPPLGPELLADAERLQRDYGILVGQQYLDVWEGSFEYALWSDWTVQQLDLVLEAAGDFAFEMRGRESIFRARMGPVPMYKREGEFWVFRERRGGWTNPRSVTLSGLYWHIDGGAWMKWTIVHELAHWWDIKNATQLSGGLLASGLWTNQLAECEVPREERGSATPRVRQWRDARIERMNVLEDWADSVAAYVYEDYADQEDLEISRARWEYVAQQINPSDPKDFPFDWEDSLFVP